MVGTHAAATCVLTLGAMLSLTVARGADTSNSNIVDPSTITYRRLRHRQSPTEQQKQQPSVSQEKNRVNRLGANAASLSSPQRNLQDEACVLQGNLFGNFDGNFRNVEFLYQGVFAEGTSQTQINLNILPTLEREIVSGILPAWFACPEPDPTGLVNGISPSDTELAVGGTCIPRNISDSKRRRDSNNSFFVFVDKTVDCMSEVEGVCYTFVGTLFVFGDLANDREAQDVLLPSIQRYIQGRSNWTAVDSRLLDVMYVISEDGQVMPPEPLPGTPSRAPTSGELGKSSLNVMD